jgi:hypothetical protein
MTTERLRRWATLAMVMAGLLLAGGCSGNSPLTTAGGTRPAPQKEAASNDGHADSASPASDGGSAAASGGGSGSGGSAGSDSDPNWSSIRAVFTDDKGHQTEVPANTVRYCINEGTGVQLNGSQDIPFEKMTSLEVTHADKLFAPDGKATVHIVLATGAPLDGTVGGNCDFFGTNDIGRFSLYPQQLKRIDFQR